MLFRSSTPLSLPDAAGDTWQQRQLEDGSTHRVLKNFPDETSLRAAVQGLAKHVQYVTWDHYWALAYDVVT